MDAIAFCEQEFAPLGSDLYYALLPLSKKKRLPLLSLFSFFQHTTHQLTRSEEQQVSAQQLKWWQQELELYRQQKPKHPITQAMLQVSAVDTEEVALLEQYLNKQHAEWQTRSLSTADELWQHCLTRWGLPVRMLAMRLCSESLPNRFIENIAQVYRRGEIFRRFAQDAQQGLFWLPLSDLAASGISTQDLLTTQSDSMLSAFWEEQFTVCQQQYEEAHRVLRMSQRRALSPLLIRARLHLRWANVMAKEGYRLHQQQLELGPWHKLLFTWRHRQTLRFGL